MRLWVQCANPSPNPNPVLNAAVGTAVQTRALIAIHVLYAALCGCGALILVAILSYMRL